MDIYKYLFKSLIHIGYIQNEKLLKNMGQELNLTEYRLDDGTFIGYKTQFFGNDLRFGNILYHKCNFCDNKYLVIYLLEGDPGRTFDFTTIHSIWHIEVNEGYFLQFFKDRL